MSTRFLNALCRLTKTLDKHRFGAEYLLKLATLGCATAVLLKVLGANPA